MATTIKDLIRDFAVEVVQQTQEKAQDFDLEDKLDELASQIKELQERMLG